MITTNDIPIATNGFIPNTLYFSPLSANSFSFFACCSFIVLYPVASLKTLVMLFKVSIQDLPSSSSCGFSCSFY